MHASLPYPGGTERGRIAYDDDTRHGASEDVAIPVLATPDRSQALTATLATPAASVGRAVDLTHVAASDGPAFLLLGPCSEAGAPRATLVLWGPAPADGRMQLVGLARPLCDLLRLDAAPLPVAVDLDPEPPPTGGYTGTLSCTSTGQTTTRPFTAVPRRPRRAARASALVPLPEPPTSGYAETGLGTFCRVASASMRSMRPTRSGRGS